MTAPTDYTALNALPDVIIREANNTLRMEMRRDGDLVAPTSGTLTLVDSTGAEIVSAQAVTITADGAEYAILAATLPSSLTYSTRWIEQWSLAMPDGHTHGVLREAHLRRFKFHSPVSVQDMVDEYDDMRRFQDDGGAGLQNKLDAASKEVQRRLFYEGKDAALVLSPGAMRGPILRLAISKVFANWYATSGNERYEKAAKAERKLYAIEWARLVLVEDLDVSGTIDPGEERRSGPAVLVTGGSPTWGGGYGGFPWPT